MPAAQTLVFLAPHENLVGVEPAYLKALSDWIDGGGRVVVAPPRFEDDAFALDEDWEGDEGVTLTDILEALDLPDVLVVPTDVAVGGNASDDRASDTPPLGPPRETYEDFPEALLDAWTTSPPPIEPVAVEAHGTLSELGDIVNSLAVPGDGVFTVVSDADEPAGTISCTDADGVRHHLVAHFPRGNGAIIVIGDPYIVANRFIAESDNSVLAVHLLSPARQGVLFDEFYHGLGVRGNPLYLLTRPGYAAVILAVLLAIAAWTWREAIFLGPPLPDAASPRRDIGEYVEAMARFFRRGRRSRPFLVREVRDGVLGAICQEVGLPPETHEKDTIIAAVARRDADRAARLEKALADIDGRLAHPQHWSQSQTYGAMQRITACL
jgi:hypothetical protein